jgi:WD40 repeat protein
MVTTRRRTLYAAAAITAAAILALSGVFAVKVLVRGSTSPPKNQLVVSPKLISRVTTNSPVDSAVFSPSGAMLADRLDDGVIELRDAGTGRLLATWNLKLPEAEGAFAFTPNGKDLAIGIPLVQDKTSEIELRDLKTKAVKQVIRVNASAIYSLAFSPDGQTLAIATGAFLVVDHLRTNTTLYVPDRAPNDFIYGIFDPTGEASYVSFSANSKFIAVVGHTGQIKLWNVAMSEFAGSALLSPMNRGIPNASYPNVSISSAAISPDASMVSVAGSVSAAESLGGQYQGPGLWIWHTKTGAITNLTPGTITQGESSEMTGSAFNPQGTILASGDSNGTIQLRNAVSDKPLSTSYAPLVGFTDVAFSPDGRRLASDEYLQPGVGASSGAIQIWSVYASAQKNPSNTVTADDLMSAPVPAACRHSGGYLSYGVQRGIPQNHGLTELAWVADGSAARARLTAFGPLTGSGTHDAATVLNCTAGGVSWPQIIAFYGPGPSLLGWSYMSNYNLPGKSPGENTVATSIAYHDGGITAKWSTQNEGDPGAIASLDYSAELHLVNGKVIASNLSGVTEEPTAQTFVNEIQRGNLSAASKLGTVAATSMLPALVHEYHSAFSASMKCYGLNDIFTMPAAISQMLNANESNDMDRVCALGPLNSSAQWIVLAMQHLGFRHWQVRWVSST